MNCNFNSILPLLLILFLLGCFGGNNNCEPAFGNSGCNCC